MEHGWGNVFSKPNPSIHDVKGSGYTHDISSPFFSLLEINERIHVTRTRVTPGIFFAPSGSSAPLCVWIRLLDWVRNKTWWWQEPAPGVNIILINRSEIPVSSSASGMSWLGTQSSLPCLDDNSDTATNWDTTNTRHHGNILSSWLLKKSLG